jgi:deazaflavin-dependent oxidoreductase (nitroreductase family)
MPSNFTMKALNVFHHTVLTLSFGKIGWKAANMPVLELTTTGRKSGEPRTVLLTSPLQLGDTIVVVASRGGDDHHPAWFVNLEANPNVVVALQGGPKRAMTARIASPDERAELWPKVTTDHANYAGYQAKTEREIPLVLLEPAG